MRRTLLLAILLIQIFISSAQPGATDLSFNPNDLGFGLGDGPNHILGPIALQNDGKILIGGSFSTYNGSSANHIARLNSDGSIDESFNSGMGTNYSVRTIIQDSNKIIIAGEFTTYNGNSRNRIARLNADGSIDPSFNPGTGFDQIVRRGIIQSNGKAVFTGNFTSYNNTPANSIARINPDGTLDTLFSSPVLSVSLTNIEVQNDDKLIVGGNFSYYDGVVVNNIMRLNSDGSIDSTFNQGSGPNDYVSQIEMQSDGKILIAGSFSQVDGVDAFRFARLNSDGSIDTTFTTGSGTDQNVSSIKILADGRILIAGYFKYFNGIEVNGIAILHTDGSLDQSFDPGSGITYPHVNPIGYAIEQPDGNILVGGSFIKFNGVIRNRILRLHSDGSMDELFNPGNAANGPIYTTLTQNDDKTLIGGDFTGYFGIPTQNIARLNPDGSLDTTFNAENAIGGHVVTMSIQDDGKIVVGGYFNTNIGYNINHILRLNNDGSIDTTFLPEELHNIVIATAIQSDGKIILGGSFTTYSGNSYKRILRLNSDGSFDHSFDAAPIGANNYVRSIHVQDDDKIIVGGNFTSLNGISINYLARLNPDGSHDHSFDTGVGPNGEVMEINIQSDGKIVIVGDFTKYNNIYSSRIVRLNTDGSIDQLFDPGFGANKEITSAVIHDNGKIYIGGDFTTFDGTTALHIACLEHNGSIDPSFNTGTGTNDFIHSLAKQSNNKVIITGEFTSYNGVGRNRIAKIIGSDINAISQENTEDFFIYPNPVTNELNISLHDPIGESEINILTLNGKVIQSLTMHMQSATIDISDLAKGIYIVEIKKGDNQVVNKFIKI